MKNYEYSIELREKYNYKDSWCMENSFDLANKYINFSVNKILRAIGFIIDRNEKVAIFHSWNVLDNLIDIIDVIAPETLKTDIEYHLISIDNIENNLKTINEITEYYKKEIKKFVSENKNFKVISHREVTTGEIIYFNLKNLEE
jgi:hypothetical protein